MKNIKYLFLLILFLNTTSCEEGVLDKQPLDIISDNLVWNDKDLVDSYVADLYYEVDFMGEDFRAITKPVFPIL